MTPSWPPELLTLEMCDGDWDRWKELLWSAYKKQFLDERPLLFGKPVMTRRDPEHDGKGYTFWHCVSEGPEEKDRLVIPSRAERILYARGMIERCRETMPDPKDDVVWWIKGQKPRARLLISFPDFSHLVVLERFPEKYQLITQYPIEEDHQRRKLEKQWTEAWAKVPKH